ncbi:MAG TPA: hypothetical protein VF507_05575 [Pyrinomonadaceae bacterium]
MRTKKDEHKAGAPEKPRGQETGNAGTVAQDRRAKADTAALRGRRKKENEFFADESSQHVGADGTKPRSNTPSIPAALPANTRMGESGGEKEFKRRQKK